VVKVNVLSATGFPARSVTAPVMNNQNIQCNYIFNDKLKIGYIGNFKDLKRI